MAPSPGAWPRDQLALFGEWVYEIAATAKYQMQGWLKARPARDSNPIASTDAGFRMPVATAATHLV